MSWVCSRYLLIMCSRARWWSSSDIRKRMFSVCSSRSCGFSWFIVWIICAFDLSLAKLFSKSRSSLNCRKWFVSFPHRFRLLIFTANKQLPAASPPADCSRLQLRPVSDRPAPGGLSGDSPSAPHRVWWTAVRSMTMTWFLFFLLRTNYASYSTIALRAIEHSDFWVYFGQSNICLEVASWRNWNRFVSQ